MEIKYDQYENLIHAIEHALAAADIGVGYGCGGSDNTVIWTVADSQIKVVMTLGLCGGDELVQDGYDRAAAATPSGTYVVTLDPDNVRRRPEWVGWAENACDALDRYSEDEDFAPYRDTEMRDTVRPYILGHATMGALAPFTNTTVYALCLHPDDRGYSDE